MTEITDTNVQTDVNLDPSDSRMRKSALSTPSLKIQGGRIYEEISKELRFPQAVRTYQKMALEPTIASALSLLELLISRVKWEAKVPTDAPEEEQRRAEFINWNMNNMDRPWKEYIIEFLGYLVYGHQPMEKVWERTDFAGFEGQYQFKNFRSISPSTIERWIYKISTGRLMGLRQDFDCFPSDFRRGSVLFNGGIYTDIPRKKFMLFRYNSKLDNPQGTSPLRSCFIPWKQKTLVEDYELVSTARNLGGIPHLGVDIDFLAKAGVAGSEEAEVLEELKFQAASLHAGEQSYVMAPIAYNDAGKELFKFDLLQTSANGNQAYTDTIIKRNENKMLMAFLADVLKLGTESQGSYALADSKTSLLSMGVEHHLDMIHSVLNHDLIKQMYSLNGWEYVEGESARFCFGDIETRDLDELGKFIQRVMSVGAMRSTKEVEDSLLESIGIEPLAEESMNLIETESTSRSGESQGSSGVGNTQQGGSGSDNNNDNAE